MLCLAGNVISSLLRLELEFDRLRVCVCACARVCAMRLLFVWLVDFMAVELFVMVSIGASFMWEERLYHQPHMNTLDGGACFPTIFFRMWLVDVWWWWRGEDLLVDWTSNCVLLVLRVGVFDHLWKSLLMLDFLLLNLAHGWLSGVVGVVCVFVDLWLLTSWSISLHTSGEKLEWMVDDMVKIWWQILAILPWRRLWRIFPSCQQTYCSWENLSRDCRLMARSRSLIKP